MRARLACRLHIAASLLALAVVLAAAPPLRANADRREGLSLTDRLAVFDDIWQTIHKKYYDPTFNGVDWERVRRTYRPRVEATQRDEEFYTLMKRMVGELREAHTRFHTAAERRRRQRWQATSVGVALFEVEGHLVVLRVEPDSEADRAGVRPGMIVQTIDGQGARDRLTDMHQRLGASSSERATRLRACRALLGGAGQAMVRLGLLHADGRPFDVQLVRHVVSTAPRVITRHLASGVGYLRLNRWRAPAHKEVRRALKRLRHAPGLIVDLRGNPGGTAKEMLEVAGYFFQEQVSFGWFLARASREIELVTARDARIYAGAVAILIDERSQSASEVFAVVMQERGRARLVGRRTCGCVLGTAGFRKVAGGGELAVSELAYLSPHGQRLEGTGVAPDETVALRRADLASGRDRALERAEQVLLAR